MPLIYWMETQIYLNNLKMRIQICFGILIIVLLSSTNTKTIKFKIKFNIKKANNLIMIKYNISTSLNYFVTIWSNNDYF